jgi:tetratricopeptide (TPR) repeat protein
MKQDLQVSETKWTSPQAYGLAVFCLLLGVTFGYLFRGSASPTVAATSAQTSSAPQGMPTPAQQKAMLDSAAAPLLEAVTKNPNDFESIVKLGNLYYDGQQFHDAVQYYEQALKLRPDTADVRTDLGTSYWYLGDADRAIAEFQKSLKLRPDHAGTWFNMGIVKWQGKGDPAGAVAAWQELLKRNPNYPEKARIEELIAKAKKHVQG